MMKKIISLLFVCILLTACGNNFKTITTNEATELINKGATIIDVRTKEEYNEGHIKNAKNIPLDEITSVSFPKDTVIIVYCATGIRSNQAANKLLDMGYTSLYNLDGGLLNWGGELE